MVHDVADSGGAGGSTAGDAGRVCAGDARCGVESGLADPVRGWDTWRKADERAAACAAQRPSAAERATYGVDARRAEAVATLLSPVVL